MTSAENEARSLAILIARSLDGSEVERHELPLDEYYQSLHELIDNEEYRAGRAIVFVEGRLFDPEGNLFQEFRNRYAADGRYEGGRIVHADGTVNEN